jgi:hypothetical protein
MDGGTERDVPGVLGEGGAFIGLRVEGSGQGNGDVNGFNAIEGGGEVKRGRIKGE